MSSYIHGVQLTKCESEGLISQMPTFKERRLIESSYTEFGVSEEGVEEGIVIAARVHIHGPADAGGGFWLKVQLQFLQPLEPIIKDILLVNEQVLFFFHHKKVAIELP